MVVLNLDFIPVSQALENGDSLHQFCNFLRGVRWHFNLSLLDGAGVLLHNSLLWRLFLLLLHHPLLELIDLLLRSYKLFTIRVPAVDHSKGQNDAVVLLDFGLLNVLKALLPRRL